MTREMSTKLWFEHIMAAFFTTLFGLVLLFLTVSFIFKNEKNHSPQMLSLRQTENALISIPNHPINPKNNNHPVYISGYANTNAVLTDKLFDISENALKLNRNVEMYQWQEKIETLKEKSVNGKEITTTNYTYHKIWSDQLIDNTKFKESKTHVNPKKFPLNSEVQYAPIVKVGDFHLPKFMIEKINYPISINITQSMLKKIKSKFKKSVHDDGESIFVGKNPAKPEIGEFTVTISKITQGPVSIIAAQDGDTFKPYASPHGVKISLISIGQVSSDAMIRDAEDEKIVLTWLFRGATLVLMIFSIYLITGALFRVLADFIPIFRYFVIIGSGLISFVAGLLLWILVTCMAWLSIKPLLSVGFIIFFIIIYIVVKYVQKFLSTR